MAQTAPLPPLVIISRPATSQRQTDTLPSNAGSVHSRQTRWTRQQPLRAQPRTYRCATATMHTSTHVCTNARTGAKRAIITVRQACRVMHRFKVPTRVKMAFDPLLHYLKTPYRNKTHRSCDLFINTGITLRATLECDITIEQPSFFQKVGRCPTGSQCRHSRLAWWLQ